MSATPWARARWCGWALRSPRTPANRRVVLAPTARRHLQVVLFAGTVLERTRWRTASRGCAWPVTWPPGCRWRRDAAASGSALPRRVAGTVSARRRGVVGRRPHPLASPPPYLVEEQGSPSSSPCTAPRQLGQRVPPGTDSLVRHVRGAAAGDRARLVLHLAPRRSATSRYGATRVRAARATPPPVDASAPLRGCASRWPGHPPIGATGPRGSTRPRRRSPWLLRLRDELQRRGYGGDDAHHDGPLGGPTGP